MELVRFYRNVGTRQYGVNPEYYNMNNCKLVFEPFRHWMSCGETSEIYVGMDFTALGKLETGHFAAVFLNLWFLTHASPHAVGCIIQVDQEM